MNGDDERTDETRIKASEEEGIGRKTDRKKKFTSMIV